MLNKAIVIAAFAAFSTLALGAEHTVSVSDSKGDITFTPSDFKANTGDTVKFEFHVGNHSVAQSSFQDPCLPIAESSSSNGTKGFYSGYYAISPSDTTFPTFTIDITDDSPIWFYCTSPGHCQGGMVGVINAPANTPSRTLAVYKQDASKAKINAAPAKPFGGSTTSPSTTSTSGGGSNSSATSTSSTSTSTHTSSGSTVSAPFTVMLGAIAAAFVLLEF